MSRILQPNEKLVMAGVLGVRAPGGEVIENVELYEIVRDGATTDPCAELTAGERAACKETVRFMAAEFGKYVRGTDALKRREKRQKEA
ncbi:MAG: hypothetical protein LBD02_10660 [Christensenellaceae bacterium]|jgi:hypothetical protein|nr:hypothetical protein [Christensenellaceae bacterium]